MKNEYRKLTIEAAVTGWIITQKGKPAEIFTRWEAVISRLKQELTSGGERKEAQNG